MNYELQKKLKLVLGYALLGGLLFLGLVSRTNIGQQFPVRDAIGQIEFTLVPSKGRDMDMMYGQLEYHKKESNLGGDIKLYRTTKKNYTNLGMWKDYSKNPYWEFEYLQMAAPPR